VKDRYGFGVEPDHEAHDPTAFRLHALVSSVSSQLAPTTLALASEMIEANEGAVALDMVSEMLVEGGGTVSPDVVAEVEALAEALGLGSETSARLRPLS
jgi:4-aminobutyrate aminotransferase-like enzyme